ncbi:helix-turn-helix domain-containing protein [Streptomyces sp. NPDC004609]|uniref:helix-turn-helix domain-containing protein n=1 Tax=Streptomyces sp. NPDC004609 TaxID=3364704 RepID=UPI0036B72C26
MKNLYERLAATDEGARALAAARLRYEALATIHESLEESGVTQTELARRLGIRKSAVNQVVHGDGNMRVSTLADYLHALGFEISLNRVKAGTARKQVVANRPHIECDDEGENQLVSWTEAKELRVTRKVDLDLPAWETESDDTFVWDSIDDSVVEYRMVQVQ